MPVDLIIVLISAWLVVLGVGGDIVLQGDKDKRPLSTVYLKRVWRSPYPFLLIERSLFDTVEACADESPVPPVQNPDGLVAVLTLSKFSAP